MLSFNKLFVLFIRNRSVVNDSSDILFLPGVSLSQSWLESLSMGYGWWWNTGVCLLDKHWQLVGTFSAAQLHGDGSFRN